MKYLNCPLIGERPITEFIYGGAIDPEPADLEGSAGRWAYHQDSRPLKRMEWWYHQPSQKWFRVSRETKANAILSIEEQ
ncbi:MAG: hypothetical protein CBC29_03800 [Methylococcaceae bacterium TMED69]|nr:sarcosine oxidase subunit delta [Pseudomonadota bacterium]OUU75429.1 MAG: hypothetical protein CBC29_03800 [Methylococcaceae bacterium TMED69]|tara:strand:- start:231 stop:467 length:237 start_codon:yes stop_codon:yes gene_type:complete